MQEFHAIYENGVLRPLTPLGLPELTEVVATVRPANEHVEVKRRPDSIIGLMADYADELDEIVEEAMRARETQPFRAGPGTMIDRTLLDTDIYSEILKGRNRAVTRRATEYEARFGQFTISVVTLAEIVKGIQKRGDVDEIDKVVRACDLMDILHLEPSSAIIAGKIYGLLEKQGQSIDRADPLIAGIALAHDLTLATGNTRHFQRVVNLGFPLRLVNWRDEPT